MLLQQIFEKVKVENALSKAKYGFWKDIPEPAHGDAIRGEFAEWYEAYIECDPDGEHGEIAELIDVINVCCRRIQFLTGEVDA